MIRVTTNGSWVTMMRKIKAGSSGARRAQARARSRDLAFLEDLVALVPVREMRAVAVVMIGLLRFRGPPGAGHGTGWWVVTSCTCRRFFVRLPGPWPRRRLRSPALQWRS